MSGSNGTLEARWDGSTPPVSKIVGIRRGQSAAEELAVPDSYFAGVDRGRPFSIFEKQSVGPRLFVDAVLEDRPLRPDFGGGHAVQCVVEAASEPSEPPWVTPQGQNSACFEDVVERGLGRHSHLREAGLEQDPV